VIIYGDPEALARGAELMGVAPPERVEAVTRRSWPAGRPSVESGRAQVAYLEAAIADARAGRVSAVVTAPIHKASCQAAGFAFPGHTELLAARFGVPSVTMMFAGPRMRVSLATIHHALADVPRVLTTPRLETTILQTVDALVRDFGVGRPRVAVAALNPHAGESGLFGDEEARIVRPAIEAARAARPEATITGPHVPDAVFRNHVDGRSDAVVALYHDQGLIPVKVVDFEEAVNVTLGLPIVRTSPDHGVAHDIAGTGRARTGPMSAALALARKLASKKAG
jgi:4-hydroxythreonine-4-phosphate dehydrogenase